MDWESREQIDAGICFLATKGCLHAKFLLLSTRVKLIGLQSTDTTALCWSWRGARWLHTPTNDQHFLGVSRQECRWPDVCLIYFFTLTRLDSLCAPRSWRVLKHTLHTVVPRTKWFYNVSMVWISLIFSAFSYRLRTWTIRWRKKVRHCGISAPWPLQKGQTLGGEEPRIQPISHVWHRASFSWVDLCLVSNWASVVSRSFLKCFFKSCFGRKEFWCIPGWRASLPAVVLRNCVSAEQRAL